MSDIPAIFGADARPDIAYGSIIPSYITIADNFSRDSFTKRLNDLGSNERPRSQITGNSRSVSLSKA